MEKKEVPISPAAFPEKKPLNSNELIPLGFMSANAPKEFKNQKKGESPFWAGFSINELAIVGQMIQAALTFSGLYRSSRLARVLRFIPKGTLTFDYDDGIKSFNGLEATSGRNKRTFEKLSLNDNKVGIYVWLVTVPNGAVYVYIGMVYRQSFNARFLDEWKAVKNQYFERGVTPLPHSENLRSLTRFFMTLRVCGIFSQSSILKIDQAINNNYGFGLRSEMLMVRILYSFDKFTITETRVKELEISLIEKWCL